MISTLCTSCNRPAPEYDRYQELVQNVLAQMAQGVTVIRLVSQGVDAKKEKIPQIATEWCTVALDFIHQTADYREMVSETNGMSDSPHAGCAEWKQTYRRMNALAMDLDFMRRDLIGHFVPGGVS